MALTPSQKRYLRGLAHALKPVALVGASKVSEGVIARVDNDLEHHELVKVKLNDATREEVEEARVALVEGARAEHVQTIGHTLVLYRRRKKDPDIKLPK